MEVLCIYRINTVVAKDFESNTNIRVTSFIYFMLYPSIVAA